MKHIKLIFFSLIASTLFCNAYAFDSEAVFKQKYNLEIGSDVQAYSANLDSFATMDSTPISHLIVIGDETTPQTVATGKITFRAPYAFTLTEVRTSVTTAPTDATLTVDVNEGGVSVFSTVVSIDSTEKTSTTAAVPAVISDSTIADDAEITIDVDQIGSTVAGAGLKVWLIGTLPL